MRPKLDRMDHVHVFVTDRDVAERWYRDVLGLRRKPELESWAVPHGPLMLENEERSIMLALFQKPQQSNRSTVAFGVSGESFVGWLTHLMEVLPEKLEPIDHGIAWSVYFSDPDGNPYEITTYEYEVAANLLFNNTGSDND